MDPFDRLMARVDTIGDCWVFTGRPTKAGYSQVGEGKKGRHYGHRLAYERLVGPIPEGHVLHHECENKVCVNPAHLTPLPVGDHRSDHEREKGHGLDTCVACGASEWYTRPDGKRRVCKPCNRRRSLEHYHRTKGH